MKINKQREISAAATTPGSTFSIRSSLSVSTRPSAFSRRSPACDTCDPSNQGPRIDTAFVSRFSIRRGFNSLGLQARDKVEMLEVGGQYHKHFVNRIYEKMELSSRRREM